MRWSPAAPSACPCVRARRHAPSRNAPVHLLLLLAGLSFARSSAEVPSADYVFPAGGQQGTTVPLSVGGKLDPWPVRVWTDCSGLTFKTNEAKGKFTVEISTNAPLGPHLIRFYNPDGASAPRGFVVGPWAEAFEKEPNDKPDQAQPIERLPVTINGRWEKAEDTDSFAIKLDQGQWLVASVDAYALDSPVDPVLYLLDSAGTKVAFNHDGRSLDPLLAYRAEKAGTFILQLAAFAYPPKADVRLTGGESAVYRLTISRGPVARYAFPMGVQRGRKTALQVMGWNLDATGRSISREIDASRLDKRADHLVLELAGVENRLCLPVSDTPEAIEREPNNTIDSAQPITVPCTINGRLDPAGDEDRFVFTAKKGDPFRLRVESERLGFPLDALLRVEDRTGKALARSDDAGRSADPELSWAAPADGSYTVAVTDLMQRGGSDYVYRLEVIRPQPDFRAVVEGHAFRLEAGKTADVKVNVSRLSGFAGSLLVVAEGMPNGASSTAATVPAAGGDVILKLSAAADAKPANQSFRVLTISPDLDAPQVRVAVSSLKGQNAAAGDLLINQTADLWLTVLAQRPPESKRDDKAAPKPK